VVEKNKITELDDRRLTLVIKKLGDKSISAPTWWKCWGNASLHPPPRVLLSLTYCRW